MVLSKEVKLQAKRNISKLGKYIPQSQLHLLSVGINGLHGEEHLNIIKTLITKYIGGEDV